MIHGTRNGLVTDLGDCDEGSIKGKERGAQFFIPFSNTNSTARF